MSAVPALRPRYQPRYRPEPHARTQEKLAIRPRLKVVEKPRTNFGVLLGVRVVSFAFLVGTTYLASALAGQMMVEKVRHQAIDARERTQTAMAVLGPMQAQVNQAQDATVVQKWAASNGFGAPEWAAQPSSGKKGLVASTTP